MSANDINLDQRQTFERIESIRTQLLDQKVRCDADPDLQNADQRHTYSSDVFEVLGGYDALRAALVEAKPLLEKYWGEALGRDDVKSAAKLRALVGMVK